VPKYKFRWSNVPQALLDELCQALFIDGAGLEPSELLDSEYGARPKDDFVGEAWDVLREGWLHHDKESRDWVVAALRSVRGEDGQISNRKAQMEYLRGLRNAKNLRTVVLEAFIELGEQVRANIDRDLTNDPPTPAPPPPEPPNPKPPSPPTGEDVSTAVEETSADLNVAPGSVVVVRDEEWLVTKAEQGADGWLVHVRGLSELVADITAAFYSSLDKIEPQDPRQANVVADGSSGYRDARLWLEALLRKTPVPYGDQSLAVSTHMLADALKYQKAAVTKALDPHHIRPRILIADAVGLGKTIEIGMILSELVRRGRGDKILVVTPKHVLEQMQHELWCRFALPFVRLDSAGIQKVRQKLPDTRNPFTYFKRAIISIDTLKSPRYKAHLARHTWDAVVIDEAHNVTNVGVQNNELARLLAPNTEALILASATPHNGRNESFAELLRLLDPTVVKPDGTFTREGVESVLIRRHRYSPDVATEVGGDWAERAEPVHRLVKPSPAEDDVAAELSQTWLHPESGQSPYSGDTKALFPWTLAKAFLSSPAALAESIKQRRAKLDPADRDQKVELKALETLDELNAKALASQAGKFAAVVERLKEVGVGANSPDRAVVFAERVATLRWLTEHLPKATGVKPENVAMLHGGLSDVEQQEIVDNFKLETSPVRVLVTGDVASEGVNLHAQCHHLIHYDIPWSLIRIEQRNGRIDRYGQKCPPVISSLILEPSDPDFSGDLRVLSKLLDRENHAHTTLGDVASLMGKHSVTEEENVIREVLAKGAEEVEATVAGGVLLRRRQARAPRIASRSPSVRRQLPMILWPTNRPDRSPSASQRSVHDLATSRRGLIDAALIPNCALYFGFRFPMSGPMELEVVEKAPDRRDHRSCETPVDEIESVSHTWQFDVHHGSLGRRSQTVDEGTRLVDGNNAVVASVHRQEGRGRGVDARHRRCGAKQLGVAGLGALDHDPFKETHELLTYSGGAVVPVVRAVDTDHTVDRRVGVRRQFALPPRVVRGQSCQSG
jgi:superfamily II DNA or RNA helicase